MTFIDRSGKAEPLERATSLKDLTEFGCRDSVIVQGDFFPLTAEAFINLGWCQCPSEASVHGLEAPGLRRPVNRPLSLCSRATFACSWLFVACWQHGLSKLQAATGACLVESCAVGGDLLLGPFRQFEALQAGCRTQQAAMDFKRCLAGIAKDTVHTPH